MLGIKNPRKPIFLNPVLCVPWRTQTEMKYENSGNFYTLKTQPKIIKINALSNTRRSENMESLIMRFPGLKKYEARAALTMSKNKLEKAIILLELSHFYRKEIIEKRCQTGYLKKIHIELCYDSEEQDPTLRNVVLETSINFKKENSALTTYNKQNTTCAINVDNSTGPRNQKVGVVITKTMTGYKAAAFEEKY